MKYRKQILFILAAILIISCRYEDIKETDICIYGGTSAGVIAAYTAARQGKTVILVEPGNHLGGMSSGGLGYTDIGNKYVVTGLARDFYRRLGTHYGKLEQWIFEPGVAESVFSTYIEEAGIEVWRQTRLHDVKKTGNRLEQIIVENSQNPKEETNRTIRAKVFIDCSYEGDLMARTGVSYTVGRESNNTYNETYNGVQLMKGHQFWDNVDPYVIKGDPSSGLLWGVSANKLEPTGSGDKKVQAYNFRITLTDNPGNRIPITKPENYDPSKYELLARIHEVAPRRSVHDIFIWSLMPNRKTDINNCGPFSTDMIGMNWQYPEANYEERARIWKEHIDYTKGLLYFVGNDPRMPQNIRETMQRWGYPKDEFMDNGNWSHQLYIREARRMIGELVMTQHHCEGRQVCSDTIGWAAYTMDSHNCDRIIVDEFVRNEGNVEIGGFPPYPISYKAITPKKEEAANLIVPVCLSASHIAYGSIRMEPVFMVLAQSAATAACMAIDEKTDVQQIDLVTLQQALKENPLSDGSTPEILIDNDNKKGVTLKGDWELRKDTWKSYGAAADFLADNTQGSEAKSVIYTPEIKSAGLYHIYMYFPMMDDGASLTTVLVNDGETITGRIINKANVVVEGQTSGEWVDLGEYKLSVGTTASVEITNKDANGVVAADAVLFLPVK